MKPNHYSRKKRQLKFLAKKLEYLLIYHREDASSQIEKLLHKIKKLVRELRHILSAADLKKILGAVAIFIGISFSNNSSAQSFASPQTNPFGIDSVTYWAIPAFADLDGDGDMDLLVGEYEGSMQYFENTGSSLNPAFASPQVNPFGLDSTIYLSLPAFADLDGDGDEDLLVGEEYGSMQYFENTGSASNPQFSAPQANPFGLVSTYNFAAPAFTDLDDDGDLDLLVGEYEGALKYFENTGTEFIPQFAAPQTNPFGLDSTYVNAFPAFADLDEDGDMDLLVGNYYGEMKYFENSGSASNPQFEAPQVNPFGLVSTYVAAFPAFVDLDADGDLDLLVGEYYGAMQYFENTTVSGISNHAQNIELKLFPNPVVDILRIEVKERIERLEIFNILGESIVSFEGDEKNISLNGLKPGIYTLNVIFTDSQNIHRTIIKK